MGCIKKKPRRIIMLRGARWRRMCSNKSIQILYKRNRIICEQSTGFESMERKMQRTGSMTYWRICRRSVRSLTICLVLKLTRCQIGSSCLRIAISKLRCNALSKVQSSISSPVFDFFNSLILVSTHSSTAFWISRILSLIGTSNSMTSAFLYPSKASATVTWKRGHKDALRKKRLRIILAKGANPVVKGSGESENAFRKPDLLTCRYIRIMNASTEVARTLPDN